MRIAIQIMLVSLALWLPGQAATVQVSMTGNKFVPATVTVKAGDTVKWTNNDSHNHNVKSDDKKTFTSENFGKGGTFTFVFTTAGSFPYNCSLHLKDNMVGTVTVQGGAGVQPRPMGMTKVFATRNDALWRDVLGRRLDPGSPKIRIPERLPATP